MNTALGIVGGLVVGAAIGAGAVTLYKGKLPGGGATTAAVSTGPVMELDGKTYTEADLPADVQSQIFDARHETHERVNALLSQFALQVSLAKEKGLPEGGKLPPFEELVEAPAPSEEELKALFEANKERLPPGTSFDTIKGDIEKYIKNQKMSEVLRAKNDQFKQGNRLKLLVSEPVPPQVDLDVSGFAAKGPATAAHTLVEVADYLCPHCQQTQPEVEALVKELGDKLRFVAVPFSLRPESLSGALARGAYCARQQSDENFWKYHEAAFNTAKTKGWKATDPSAKEPITEVATAAGIDVAKVEACFDSAEALAFVKSTVDKMNDVGVSGTPTFFMNGRRLQMHGESLKDLVAGQMQAASH